LEEQPPTRKKSNHIGREAREGENLLSCHLLLLLHPRWSGSWFLKILDNDKSQHEHSPHAPALENNSQCALALLHQLLLACRKILVGGGEIDCKVQLGGT
jgi:hypothetical protein